MENLTPRIIGLAQNGFDPATIAHMLGITFAQVNEGLLGQEVQGGGSGASGVGAWLNLHAEAAGASVEGFLVDEPGGFVGRVLEPSLVLTTPPFKVAPGAIVCQLASFGSPLCLSPVNLHVFVTNTACTQSLQVSTEESVDLKDPPHEFSPTPGEGKAEPGKWGGVTLTGADLSLDEQGRIRSAAGGIFVCKGTLSMEPSR